MHPGAVAPVPSWPSGTWARCFPAEVGRGRGVLSTWLADPALPVPPWTPFEFTFSRMWVGRAEAGDQPRPGPADKLWKRSVKNMTMWLASRVSRSRIVRCWSARVLATCVWASAPWGLEWLGVGRHCSPSACSTLPTAPLGLDGL